MCSAQAPASHHRLRNKCDLNSPASTRRPRRFHTSLACSTPAILPSVHPHRPHACYSPPPGPASSRGTKHLGQPHRRLATACDNVSTASQPSALVPAHTKQRRCVDSNDAPQKKAPHRAVCTPRPHSRPITSFILTTRHTSPACPMPRLPTALRG